jgi:hypothetical protein
MVEFQDILLLPRGRHGNEGQAQQDQRSGQNAFFQNLHAISPFLLFVRFEF